MGDFDMDNITYGGPACPSCGERPSATRQHKDSVRRHAACFVAMRKAQAYCKGRRPVTEILAVLDRCIGPMDDDDVADYLPEKPHD